MKAIVFIVWFLVIVMLIALLTLSVPDKDPAECYEEHIRPLEVVSAKRAAHCEALKLEPVVEFFYRCNRTDIPVITGCGAKATP
jgi:hypothetical protein